MSKDYNSRVKPEAPAAETKNSAIADQLEATERTRINRYPPRGTYERTAIEAILDEAMVCHVGFVVDGQPYVMPTIHARDGARLFIQASPMSRKLRSATTTL